MKGGTGSTQVLAGGGSCLRVEQMDAEQEES